MKFLITVFFIITCLFSAAQKVVKYYDADWIPTTHDKAFFYAEFIKEGNVYKCISYWMAGNRLRGRSNFADTIMENPIGTQLLYFKNGHIEDSILYSDGKTKYLFHYHPNNTLAVHYYLPDNGKEAISEGYDEDGKKIKNFIFSKDAEFKGGQKAWQSYLSKNASKDLTVKGDGTITASVQIQFTIDEDGNVTKTKIFKSSGYKEIDRDALRVISESPVWNNAIQFNKPVKAMRIQPITYTLNDKKK